MRRYGGSFGLLEQVKVHGKPSTSFVIGRTAPSSSPDGRGRSRSRLRWVAEAIVLAVVLGEVPYGVASEGAASSGPVETPIPCVPETFRILALSEDSLYGGVKWGDHAYREISRGLLFRAFIEQISDLKVFDSVSRNPERPFDRVLSFRIERLQRQPMSSPDDLWLEVSLTLRDRQHRGLWTDRFAFLVEPRAWGLRRQPDNLFFGLLTRLAAKKLAGVAASELDRFLAGVRGTAPRTCPARSVVRLDLAGLTPEDEEAVLGALSGSPCYEVSRVLEHGSADSDAERVIVEARADSSGIVDMRLWIPGMAIEGRRLAWQVGDAGARNMVLKDASIEVAAYHHRNSLCPHNTGGD